MSSDWKPVTDKAPCPACGKPDWCAWSKDGSTLKCERSTTPPAGLELIRRKAGGALFRPAGAKGPSSPSAKRPAPNGPLSSISCREEAERLGAKLTKEQVQALATDLGVAAHALESLGLGWAEADDLRKFRASGAGWEGKYPTGAFAFPERDGTGRVVGFSLRTLDGRKGGPSSVVGASRGIVVPSRLGEGNGPVLVVEGASDVAALVTLGLSGVGRPSNFGGVEALAQLLKRREVLIVGERDEKPDGSWPGRDGAERVTSLLASAWGKPVRWTLSPVGAKDVRVWLRARVAGGLDLSNADACHAAGRELLSALESGAEEAAPERKPAQAELLVRLAREIYRFGVAEGQEPFAVELKGPNIALPLKGSSNALRASLALEYQRRFKRTPSASALADALMVLQGEAMCSAPEPVFLRVALSAGNLVIDLGDASGQAILVGPAGWSVVERSPVLFRRTALTATLPRPERGGGFDQLWTILNVAEESRALLLGWLIAAFLPDIPHPILLLGGQQGTGKSSTAKVLVSLLDPSSAPLRAQPRDFEDWALPVSNCWVSAFDNVSTIPDWWSDALCKGVTGDGLVRRRLYADNEVVVLAFQRVLLLTSIDAGTLRGDLGDRVLLVDLEPIPAEKRRSERELQAEWQGLRLRVLGALLDRLVVVLKGLPSVQRSKLPRMADFAQVLKAMDTALGTDALERYEALGPRIAEEVIEGELVGQLVQKFAKAEPWRGNATELLEALSPTPAPRGWPKDGRALAGRLRRLAPALRAIGVEALPPSKTDKTRCWTIRLAREQGERTAQSARSPEGGPDDGSTADPGRAMGLDEDNDRPMHRPDENVPGDSCAPDAGRSGDLGHPVPVPSDDEVREALEERAAIQAEGAPRVGEGTEGRLFEDRPVWDH